MRYIYCYKPSIMHASLCSDMHAVVIVCTHAVKPRKVTMKQLDVQVKEDDFEEGEQGKRVRIDSSVIGAVLQSLTRSHLQDIVYCHCNVLLFI